MKLTPAWVPRLSGVVDIVDCPEEDTVELVVPLVSLPPVLEPESEVEDSATLSTGKRLRSALRTLICDGNISSCIGTSTIQGARDV